MIHNCAQCHGCCEWPQTLGWPVEMMTPPLAALQASREGLHLDLLQLQRSHWGPSGVSPGHHLMLFALYCLHAFLCLSLTEWMEKSSFFSQKIPPCPRRKRECEAVDQICSGGTLQTPLLNLPCSLSMISSCESVKWCHFFFLSVMHSE